MNRKFSIFGLSALILGLIIVPGFTADMNQGDSSGKTFGCGSVAPVSNADLDDMYDGDGCDGGDNFVQVRFVQGEGLTETKNDLEAFGTMCYSFCGPEFEFVFNGHHFTKDDDATYLLMLQDPADFSYHLLGSGTPNNGGNLHIKGKMILENFQEAVVFLSEYEEGLCDRDGLCDRPSGPAAMIGVDTISYNTDCVPDGGTCDAEIFSADLTEPVPPDTTVTRQEEAITSGKAIFIVDPSGEEIFYKLVADNLAATVSSVFIRIQDTGTETDPIPDQRLVQIFPSEMDLSLLPGHEFMAIGVINADDRMNTAVLGTTDPVGSLIRGFNAGLTYVNVLGPEGGILVSGTIDQADCDALRDLWELHVGNWGCSGDDGSDDGDGDDGSPDETQ